MTGRPCTDFLFSHPNYSQIAPAILAVKRLHAYSTYTISKN
ncbi:unnamed protein product [Amoebophrya sp. A120]|nr:unnamed protein product [Amoebophrya sp. A120]|eukprot:GSA120T00024367001.1